MAKGEFLQVNESYNLLENIPLHFLKRKLIISKQFESYKCIIHKDNSTKIVPNLLTLGTFNIKE